MELQLVHTFNQHIDLCYGNNCLSRYVYQPHTPLVETRKPYLHPVNTLGGNTVTIFRPHDHLWHHGIAMTSAHLSIAEGEPENFWGGPTYVRDQGYAQLDNNGHIEHQTWDDMQCDGNRATLKETLRWVTHDGHPWLSEQREIGVGNINPAESCWQLDFATALTNVAGQPLVFGSPTTAGRPMAGYGGLFWRGPRSFLGGKILAADGLQGPEVMGQPAAWLAFVGAHDGNAQQSTLVFIDRPGNLRYPSKWFVRNDPYGCVSFAFSFDEEYTLAPGETLALRYRIIIADGEWSREQIERYARS